MNNPTQSNGMKFVYTVVEGKGGRSYWVKIGVGFPNSDGSMNLKLDALPVNGSLQLRDPQAWDERRDAATAPAMPDARPAEALA